MLLTGDGAWRFPLVAALLIVCTTAGYFSALTTGLPGYESQIHLPSYGVIYVYLVGAIPSVVICLAARSLIVRLATFLPPLTALDAARTILMRGHQVCSVCCQGTISCDGSDLDGIGIAHFFLGALALPVLLVIHHVCAFQLRRRSKIHVASGSSR